jgi:flagellar motor switch protein FliM
MMRFLSEAQVELDGRLDGTDFSVKDLLTLEEGDIITFDHPVGRPLDCMVNGKRKFQGQLIGVGNTKAFQIEGSI